MEVNHFLLQRNQTSLQKYFLKSVLTRLFGIDEETKESKKCLIDSADCI